MAWIDWKTLFWKLIAFLSIFLVTVCYGITDPRDVVAINNLHASLGLPVLTGWVPNGGDPCAENWQGVQCVNANITAILLSDLNLGGVLGDSLGDFTSIIQIDMSNNHIGGGIPSNLPSTIMTFYLSSNQLTGSIPETLSSLGEVIDLDLSGNRLSGQLPPSMGTLLFLTTLHLQDNQLTGTLDVLQSLPLMDLNVENNLFSGPIPQKLLTIPNFKSEGNPFNTSVLPYSPSSSPFPSSDLPPTKALGPSSASMPDPTARNKSHSSKKTMLIVSMSVALVLILLGSVICILIYCRNKAKQVSSKIDMTFGTGSYDDSKEKPIASAALPKLYSPVETGYKEPALNPLFTHRKGHHRTTSSFTSKAKDESFDTTSSITKSNKDHEIDMNVLYEDLLPPPFIPVDKVSVNPLPSPISTTSISTKIPGSVSSFTIASLQQYTKSFSQVNLIGRGLIGSVYRAETDAGRMLSVKKLDKGVCKSNEEFLELVCSLSRLQHANLVGLVGYCAEHEEQLLVYEYCINGSLYEALHLDEEIHKNLSWKIRIRLALGAARALEYMHEVCQPPRVHKNFKSANILLDDELVVHVSDCGLAPLLSSGSLNQLTSSGYGSPELELGNYTIQSDVYSFGVVMLEILTGRKSYDRSRPRGEQFLVRWAVHQLHDIDSLVKMVDPSLEGTYPTKSLSRFADIISLCLQPEPEFRPPMSEIVQSLLHMI